MPRYQICNCNQSMPLDGAAIGAALGGINGDGTPLPVHTELCRRQIDRFTDAAQGSDDLVIACTQEKALFAEIASGMPAAVPMRFVNIRETGGWAADARLAMPKIAALLAAEALPEPDPVPTVSYQSAGNTLIVGPADRALVWAERLKERLAVTVLLTGDTHSGASLPVDRAYPVVSGRDVRVKGWLGAFDVSWNTANPIDLDACTRCGKCVAACPENAIDWTFQIDLSRCRDHRDCVKACGPIQAIDFQRPEETRSAPFDLVFDLGDQPAITLHQPPQGYFAPGADVARQFGASLELTQMTGEFEKPKFFLYKEKLCAHSRSGQPGCNACIEVCSAAAIVPDGDRVRVQPNLCVGCGACSTVCPSGAMGYAYPRPVDQGQRFKTVLSTYRRAGGEDAALLLHSAGAGAARIAALGRAASAGSRKKQRGIPARVIPLEVFHTASVGLDLWLAALAWGAAQVVVLTTDEEAPDYLAALDAQMALANTILDALGYGKGAVQRLHVPTANAPALAGHAPEMVLEMVLEAALHALRAAPGVTRPATFGIAGDKRGTIEFAIDHLIAASPDAAAAGAVTSVPLPAGAPFGRIHVDTTACTLCMACVGACPESALHDNADLPQLRFTERNCVQCGLCVATCPENAITLEPRLGLSPDVRQPQIVNAAKPFHCIRCSKPFGTERMIQTMIEKLSSHSMFGGAAAKRLQMCGDCRVIDMMTSPGEMNVNDLKRPPK